MHSLPQDTASLWQNIVATLGKDPEVGDYGLDSYISRLQLIEDTGTTVILGFPSDLMIAWVEVNYIHCIAKALEEILGAPRCIEFTPLFEQAEGVTSSLDKAKTAPLHAGDFAMSQPRPATEAPRPKKAKKVRKQRYSSTGLNAEFTFENFVIGPNSEFAHATAQAVVDRKSYVNNPLFIHSGSGLGKTHLLHAIGNAIVAQNDGRNVLYVTSEEFTNSYIDVMTNKSESIATFRRKYRKVDVLLIDDVQFMARKEKTQKEFHHTFDALMKEGKQIVLSADCPASEISTMDQRLRARFDQGMAVSVARPDHATRLAILQNKRAHWKSTLLSDELLEFLAQNISSSVRHLEGALTRMAIFASFGQQQPSINDARNQLQDMLHIDQQQVNIQDVQRRVAEAFDLRVSDLTGRRRTAHIAQSRQVAMYLSRRLTERSLQDIGDAFGGRDHGTVIHAHRKIERQLLEDNSLRELVTRVSNSF